MTTPSRGDPAVGQRDCPWIQSQQCACGDSQGDHLPTLGGRVKCGGTLYHAGGVLRCRSADTLRSLVRGNCDGRGTHPGNKSSRPTLRAYSAPLFLHSALFPPKSSTQTARGEPQAAASSITSDGRTSTQDRLHAPSEGQRSGETKAPGRHRQGGYLHRYQGFEREKVSCPPVTTFRAMGGLGEFPRERGKTAPAEQRSRHEGIIAAPLTDSRGAQQPQEAGVSSARPGRGGRADSSACTLSEETRGSLAVGLSQGTGMEEGQSSAYPLELFAEGSNVAPGSPPPGRGVAAAPAWCSRSKGRPNGAKRLKAWREGAVQRGPPQNRAETIGTKMNRGLTAGSETSRRATNRRCGAVKAKPSPYTERSSAFLPYSLERPVSPERARAFFYTSN